MRQFEFNLRHAFRSFRLVRPVGWARYSRKFPPSLGSRIASLTRVRVFLQQVGIVPLARCRSVLSRGFALGRAARTSRSRPWLVGDKTQCQSQTPLSRQI